MRLARAPCAGPRDRGDVEMTITRLLVNQPLSYPFRPNLPNAIDVMDTLALWIGRSHAHNSPLVYAEKAVGHRAARRAPPRQGRITYNGIHNSGRRRGTGISESIPEGRPRPSSSPGFSGSTRFLTTCLCLQCETAYGIHQPVDCRQCSITPEVYLARPLLEDRAATANRNAAQAVPRGRGAYKRAHTCPARFFGKCALPCADLYSSLSQHDALVSGLEIACAALWVSERKYISGCTGGRERAGVV